MTRPKEERKINLGSALIGSAVTLIIGFAVGLNWPAISGQFAPFLGLSSSGANDWSALDEVYNELKTNYDGEIDQAAIIEGAKKGLTAAVGDVYTAYMDAEESSEFQNSLHGDVGAGIGVEMGLRDGYVRVLRTLPDNPARESGILAGDIIYKVNGEEVYAEDSETIANKVRGAEGTEVEITVVRDGEEKTFKMKREKINNVSAYTDYDGKTAIITVTRFDNDTGTLVRKLVADFPDHINKVILDLRDNGGGYVSAAQDLASLWIDGEKLVTQKGLHTGTVDTYANRGQATLANIKTIVLVNGGTASASEIVAGALKDYNKATILGEQTYGKGVVQTLLDLSNDTLLKVTTARWYTPNGASINGEGITPDKIVERTYDDINHNKDPQLDAAKKY